MSTRFNQFGNVSNSATRFSQAPMSDLEFSRMTAVPTHMTTFSAGDIVPIYNAEVLPHDTFSIDLDFVIRQNTILTPTMGQMFVDIFAFFVPNRVVNESWKNVQGENSSGQWVAPEVSMVPLVKTDATVNIQIPIHSVADYYGYPTQAPMPIDVLKQCHDLLFRGYLEIYNEHFRDQNYQAPIPFSKLNVYNGFFEPVGSQIGLSPTGNTLLSISPSSVPDGSPGVGSVVKEVYGEGSGSYGSSSGFLNSRACSWSALDKPLKANKLHDYFTSVLPTPQKGPEYIFQLATSAPVVTGAVHTTSMTSSSLPLRIVSTLNDTQNHLVYSGPFSGQQRTIRLDSNASSNSGGVEFMPSNLYADLSQVSGLSLSDIRFGAAVQQVYETLARGGSRYREFINSFFGLDVENPFSDTSVLLGHVRRELDLYQTAQTSPSVEGQTPQGNLAAFGYTSNGGHLFQKTFVEHGYIHIFAIVRHKNVYSSLMTRDKFRLNKLDFYLPQLANISEQPVYTREINPFIEDNDAVFGYQEAWSEYRYEPDRVSGYLRPGVSESLDIWNYADEFDSGLQIADSDWLKSNSAEVLDRSLAITSETSPQFKALFKFAVTKERPLPTYSIPGLDIL